MSNAEPVFTGDTNTLTSIDIDSPISQAKTQSCEFFIELYQQSAKEAEAAGEKQRAAVFRFLRDIAGFQPSFDTPSQPFGPMFRIDDKRSLIPADLTASDVEVVRKLAPQATNVALRARLHDILWELTKDHTAGTEAARCYVNNADQLDASGDWIFGVKAFKRGLILAAKFGRNKPLFTDAATTLLTATKRAEKSADAFHCCQLMRLILLADIGETSDFAALASKIANSARASGDWRKAKAYWELEAGWHRRGDNKAEEKKAALNAAEAAVKEAEHRALGTGASFMAAATLLAKAIEELRRAGATNERITELRQRLNEWQKLSLSEFQAFSTKVDISELVRGAREHVRGCDFPTSVLKLAFGQDLSDPDKLKEEVRENAKQSPLTFLMGAAIVDEHGRTTIRKESLFELQGATLEAALEAEAFAHASQSHWPLRVSAFIEPARQQILNDHKPTFQDLVFLVSNNPFVPPGHEGVFLRGIHAGFHGDFLIAAHLLTLQIENSLRYILESHNVDVSNLMSDGTQPVKVLGAIFGVPETEQILGRSLCFELRGCLIEKTGFDFRNRVAHGFVGESDCYSPAAVYVWWLVLRICLMPMYQAIAHKQKSSPKPAEPSEAPDSKENP